MTNEQSAPVVQAEARARALAHLRLWGADSVGEHGEANVRMLLAFADQQAREVERLKSGLTRIIQSDDQIGFAIGVPAACADIARTALQGGFND